MNHLAPVSYQQRLIEQIRAAQPLSDQVASAMLQVPRHAFLSRYYIHTPGTRAWVPQEQQDTADWYDHLYQNEGLVTQVDAHGRTLSSSSQPGIMARMLDALDLHPGLRVLEIGTGTGYNAALVATLVGDPHLVTTIDLDAEVILQATQHIPTVVGEGMTIVQGHGQDGYAPHAPYDRIMVTASTFHIPDTWLDQLAPGGILVGIIQPESAPLGAMIQATRQADQLCGSVIHPASFMPLRDASYPKRTRFMKHDTLVNTPFPAAGSLFPPRLLREDPHFAFFLYASLPDLSVFEKPQPGEIVYAQRGHPEGLVVFRQGIVALHGNPSTAHALWTRLVRLYGFWLHCGQPPITAYQFQKERHQDQTLFLTNAQGTLWPFSM